MISYQCLSSEQILLVGEGNFSFTRDFLDFNNNLGFHPQVVSSCFESDPSQFSELKLHNIECIKNKDVKVLFGVDATVINKHPCLQNHKFLKIIFNFPHIGGKMKIHLNRNLLKNFFQSACNVLDDGGSIIVALCNGQGGTEADSKIRRWDDTWQILEMAAHSDFVLKHVEPFNSSYFPNYSSVGFRSRDISFHTEGAVVHLFKKSSLKSIPTELNMSKRLELDTIDTTLGTKCCSKFYVSKILENPFESKNTPQFFIYSILQNLFDSESSHHVNRIFVTTHDGECKDSLSCVSNKQKPTTQELMGLVYNECKQSIANSELVITKHLLCNSLNKDFSRNPVICQVFLFGKHCLDQVMQFINCIFCLFKIGSNPVDTNGYLSTTFEFLPEEIRDCFEFNTLDFDGRFFECCAINIDSLAMRLFHINDWRSLWAAGGVVKENELGMPVYHPYSLYPRLYTFDICFSDNSEYTEEKYVSVLWQIAGDIITSIELLNVYNPPDRDFTCFCFRINYKSYTIPMYRKRVIDIHQNIGKLLQSVLNVNVS